jgi:hypothetical protein
MKICKRCNKSQAVTEFYVRGYRRSNICRTCESAYGRQKSKERRTLQAAETKAKREAYYAAHPEVVAKMRENTRKWKAANRELNRQFSREHAARTRPKRRAYEAKREAAKLHRTPPWLTKEQFKEIEAFYLNCPEGYQVDHIWPLQGKDGSGLHVPWNLQYLTESENAAKSNERPDIWETRKKSLGY